MGLLSKLFAKVPSLFKPDFSRTEYDNWLDFLNKGGTTKEWETLKSANRWNFPKSDVDIWEDYRKAIKKPSDKYYYLLDKIQKNWSVLYNSKDYCSPLASQIEIDCLESIESYSEMKTINEKYNKSTPTNIPAFKRLAMLYEKQGRIPEAISVCERACSFGMDETKRMKTLLAKAKRPATEEEKYLINRFQNKDPNSDISESKHQEKPKSKRQIIASEQIDSMQRVEASKSYRNKLYKMFYAHYPEMPFISQDRELNTNWMEQAQTFGVSPSKEMMVRYSDNLLPGHVYMLYWIKKIHRKRIPVYFEYQYGIDFSKEQQFLYEQGYLTSNMELTQKGESAINLHYDVIENHNNKMI